MKRDFNDFFFEVEDKEQHSLSGPKMESKSQYFQLKIQDPWIPYSIQAI